MNKKINTVDLTLEEVKSIAGGALPFLPIGPIILPYIMAAWVADQLSN